MAKIVIIAPSDADVTDAVKLLSGAGNEVTVEEPTPKTLLHIVLGLMGPNAYGFGPGYAYSAGPDAADDDKPDDESAIEDEATKDPVDDLDGNPAIEMPDEDSGDNDFNFEGVTVDGNPVEAILADQDHSTLVVEELIVGPKTSYRLNESTFSFWPSDLAMPMQRVDVGTSRVHTSREVEIKKGEKAQLLVGKDLQKMFEAKKQQFNDVADFSEYLEKRGSAAQMWLGQLNMKKLMKLHNDGVAIKFVSPPEMDWHNDKDKAREKIENIHKKWEVKGYELFDEELGDDASEMIFIKKA